MRIRLATYNIHQCVGPDGRRDPERVLSVVRGLDADLIALQEVVSHPGLQSDFVARLAQATRSRALAGVTLIREDSHYGNVLLTRLPLQSERRVDLSVADREPRGAIVATLRVDGAHLLIVATHLGLRPFERRLQVRRILATVFQELMDPPVAVRVLMGDLNEWLLWGRPVRWLRALFGRSPAPATFPSRWPCLALDRIWVEPRHCLRVIASHRAVPASAASDHLPLIAEIEIPQATPGSKPAEAAGSRIHHG